MGENWIVRRAYFCNRSGVPVKSIHRMGGTFLRGQVFGREGFREGQWIITSRISRVVYDGPTIKEVWTSSGSRYLIESVCPEYQEFMEAIEGGEPILLDWTMYKAHGGYQILGHLFVSEKSITGMVVAQDGNWITIEVIRNWFATEDSEAREKLRLLVCWPSMSYKAAEHLEGTDKIVGLEVEEAFGLKCRPVIPC